MKRIAGLVAFLALVIGLSAPSAKAEIVDARFNGLVTYGTLDLSVGGAAVGIHHAAVFKLMIGGEERPCYALDPLLDLPLTDWFQAETYPLPATSPWCEVGYIVSNHEAVDSISGSIIQLAIWKLVYAYQDPPEAVSAARADIEADAEAMVLEAQGQCGLACAIEPIIDVSLEYGAGGLVEAQVAVSVDGAPVEGVALSLSVSGGAIVTPVDGAGVTDEGGLLQVTIDPAGAEVELSLMVEAAGQDLVYVDPIQPTLPVLSFYLDDPCTFSASGDITLAQPEDPLGDPRRSGWWKKQFDNATKKKKKKKCGHGHEYVSAEVLEGYLPITVFDQTFSTLEEGLTALKWKCKKEKRALRRCFATHLNMAAGELGAFTPADLDKDGEPDGYVGDLLEEAEVLFADGEYKAAAKLCKKLNRL